MCNNCHFDRFYWLCPQIPVPLWYWISHHHQQGTDPVWQGNEVRSDLPQPARGIVHQLASDTHNIPLQNRSPALLHGPHTRYMKIVITLLYVFPEMMLSFPVEEQWKVVNLSTGYRFQYGHTFGQLTHNALSHTGTQRKNTGGNRLSWRPNHAAEISDHP